jgi:hypothetical protein
LSRKLLAERRSLQAGGIKIDFVIGVSDSSRAMQASSKVNMLASGSPAVIAQFSVALDQALVARGQAPIQLPANAVAFSGAKQVQKSAAGASYTYSAQGTPLWSNAPTVTKKDSDSSSSDDKNSTILLAFLGGACLMGFLALAMYLKHVKSAIHHDDHNDANADAYANKVANLDSQWHGEEQWGQEQWTEHQHQQSAW